MGFAFFFFLSYLIVSMFIVMRKKLNIVENTFVFLLILFVNINVSWIIFEELDLLTVTEDAMKYVGFLLNRSMILPMIIVVYLNLVNRSLKMFKKVLITIISISTVIIFSGISILFDLITYVNWNFIYDAIYFGALHLLAFYAQKLFRKFTFHEVNYS
ncbi:hypothetical protein [Halalkalibacter alkalisediminis]|uniref:Histidine kinase N-terminal 7TM region domain-containing protein n=1 Tax=Halalkalibacter alkalisediminis TaxID=935616 RepID=A0ABV6NLA3_9BACI|nr:hypothetical protein [Halalkalibacter alkalisediminis]